MIFLFTRATHHKYLNGATITHRCSLTSTASKCVEKNKIKKNSPYKKERIVPGLLVLRSCLEKTHVNSVDGETDSRKPSTCRICKSQNKGEAAKVKQRRWTSRWKKWKKAMISVKEMSRVQRECSETPTLCLHSEFSLYTEYSVSTTIWGNSVSENSILKSSENMPVTNGTCTFNLRTFVASWSIFPINVMLPP